MKAMVCSPDGDIDFVDIVSRVLQEDTLVSYFSSAYYVPQISMEQIQENGFTLKKKKAEDIPQNLWLKHTTQMT